MIETDLTAEIIAESISTATDHIPGSVAEPTAKPFTVKELSADDQPRERALRYGIASLATADLLALIIRTGTNGTPVTTLMRELLKSHDGRLHNLERTPRKLLTRFKGIGEAKALQIEAIMELIRRYNAEEAPDNPIIKGSADTYRIMRPVIANLDHEEVWVLLLNRRNELFERQRITSGTGTASLFDVKMILKRALLANAEGVMMCHNHPSGNRNPSLQDDQITRQLNDGCRQLGLTFLDHVILTTHEYYSYHDEGKL